MGLRLACIWGTATVLVLTIVLTVSRPLEVAWRCYALHRDGERASAELVEKVAGGLVVRLVDGPHAGELCSTRTSAAHRAALVPGARFGVVLPAGDPARCVPLATVERSGIVLVALTLVLGSVVLGVLAAALWLHRSFTRRVRLVRRLAGPARAAERACPSCGGPMAEGYVPLLAGLHWRTLDQPIGLPHALAGLPGTTGWRGRRTLHALRCEACEVLVLQYGTPRRDAVRAA